MNTRALLTFMSTPRAFEMLSHQLYAHMNASEQAQLRDIAVFVRDALANDSPLILIPSVRTTLPAVVREMLKRDDDDFLHVLFGGLVVEIMTLTMDLEAAQLPSAVSPPPTCTN